jgi:hypothetical protein
MKESKRFYATVLDDGGIDYRTIAETMTSIGWTMNHSSARNHVLRVLRKFVDAYSRAWGITLSDEQAMSIIKSSIFQEGILDVLNTIV